MSEHVVNFLVSCAAIAFVCTAIREDEDAYLWSGAARLLGYLVGGVLAFAVVVQLFTLWAG